MLLRPKVLFTLAAAILLICAIRRPWRLLFIFSGKGLTYTLVFVVAGLLIGAVVHELGQFCFRTKGSPWYTRRAAAVFLIVALMGINTLLPIVDRMAFAVIRTGPFLSSADSAYVLIALELIWVALLE
jgi:isoprenylcysteine carboxyl methyltransferase (ICMT) family protein YpbQ